MSPSEPNPPRQTDRHLCLRPSSHSSGDLLPDSPEPPGLVVLVVA